ncbi:MAG: BLUF domain-containing protein, partial [Hyphomicrobium sp.]
DKVTSSFDRIKRDDRHTDLRMLFTGEIAARLFPEWAMRHDPAQTWMWTREQVTAGAVQAATPDDARAIFARLAENPPTGAQSCPMAGHAVAS